MTTHRLHTHSLSVRILAVFLIGATAALPGGCNRDVSDRDIRTIALPEVRKMTASDRERHAALIDPRSPRAFAEGHIPTARNLQLTEVSGIRGDLDRDLAAHKNLIVYGDNPGSAPARAMAKRLMTAGHKGVWWYEGGLDDWTRSGNRAERSTPTPGTPGDDPAAR